MMVRFVMSGTGEAALTAEPRAMTLRGGTTLAPRTDGPEASRDILIKCCVQGDELGTDVRNVPTYASLLFMKRSDMVCRQRCLLVRCTPARRPAVHWGGRHTSV
jgi:hypothetical protein